MLQRQIAPNGVVTYISPLLCAIGVPHAFSTRIGGVSPRPFDSLNLGNPNGCDIQDLTERIRENYSLLECAAGCEGRERVWLWQVHGERVVRVERGVPHDNDTKADAIVTDDPRRSLSIRIADCVPVLMSSDDGGTVAAAHAGWRGVITGVVPRTLDEMARGPDLTVDQIRVAIGPSISLDAFEVGPEVLDEFHRAFGRDAPVCRRTDAKGHVDLREALRRQLLAAGIPPERIDTTDRCTHRDRDEFFSHRRDKGITGRMAAMIACAQ